MILGRLTALASGPLALLVTLLAAAPSHASVIYTYTGNTYTSVSQEGGSSPSDAYTTADRLTGFIELASPLAANLNQTSVSPLSFSFSDGVNTITNATVGTTADFRFTTDDAGEIDSWWITLRTFVAPPATNVWAMQTVQDVSYAQDAVSDTQCGEASSQSSCALIGEQHYTQRAYATSVPGSWQSQTVPSVPEPTTTLLLGVALVGLAVRRR